MDGIGFGERRNKRKAINMKTCPNCKAMHYSDALVCKECGYSLPESRDTQKVKIKEPDCSVRYSVEEIRHYMDGWLTVGEKSPHDVGLRDAITMLNCDQDGIEAVTERLK